MTLDLKSDCLSCLSETPPDGDGSVQVHLDPAVRIDTAKVFAVYGKGGIGKSTVSANISAALSHMSEKVMQVGCDPKRDSISTLCGKLMPTILDAARETRKMTEDGISSLIFEGYNGVLGCEKMVE